jgi:CRP/FNR family transcriptional regulator, cyclic AMP receptor protein
MEHHYAELVGVAAAAASLYAAHAKTIIPLRVAAIVANLLAMAYSHMHGTYPTFVLNALLLPLNAWRLHQMLKLIRDVATAIERDMNVDWLLRYMRPKRYKANDLMMERGEYATEAFYVVSGEVEIVEINQIRGAGTLLGEIGLFTPNGRRTMTVRCKTDVQAATMGYDQIKELYFQNPQFGFRLLHLIVARLLSNSGAIGLSLADKSAPY